MKKGLFALALGTFFCDVGGVGHHHTLSEQYLIVKHSEGGEMLGGCCIQAAFNLGNALGAFFGGIPVAMGLGYHYPALIGVPMALIGALCLLMFHRKYE